jgi:hypothetical protein
MGLCCRSVFGLAYVSSALSACEYQVPEVALSLPAVQHMLCGLEMHAWAYKSGAHLLPLLYCAHPGLRLLVCQALADPIFEAICCLLSSAAS